MRPSTPCDRWRWASIPPLLEEQGIAAAIAAQYLVAALPVRMETDGIGRYPIELEAAVYFCTLEALQNAAKYARASAITIAFRERNGALEFSVADDGVGFLAATTGPRHGDPRACATAWPYSAATPKSIRPRVRGRPSEGVFRSRRRCRREACRSRSRRRSSPSPC